MSDGAIVGASEHLGDRLARLRRLADLSQERLSERCGISVDVVRKLEQHRKHSVRLPTLHRLATGLGVEVTALLSDPPALSAEQDEPSALGSTAPCDASTVGQWQIGFGVQSFCGEN
jgi:transcriptional regulator with XRE-family HTH domain